MSSLEASGLQFVPSSTLPHPMKILAVRRTNRIWRHCPGYRLERGFIPPAMFFDMPIDKRKYAAAIMATRREIKPLFLPPCDIVTEVEDRKSQKILVNIGKDKKLRAHVQVQVLLS